MAKQNSDDPFKAVDYSSTDTSTTDNPLLPSALPSDLAPGTIKELEVPKTETSTFTPPKATDTSLRDLERTINMLGWEERVGKKLSGKFPPKLQSWEEAKAQIPNWDQMPNVEQRKQYENYMQGAAELMAQWNEGRTKSTGKIDLAKWEEAFRKANPGPEKINRSWEEWFGDVGTGIAKGGLGLAITYGTIADLAMGKTRSDYVKHWSEQMKLLNEAKSDYEKDVDKKTAWEQSEINNDPDRSAISKFLGNIAIALKNTSTASVAELIGGIGPVSLSQAAIGQGAKYFAARAIADEALKQSGKKLAEKEIAKLAAAKGANWAQRAGRIMNMFMSGGDAADTAYEHVMNMPVSELKALPGFAETFREHGGDLRATREDMARSGMLLAAATGAVVGYAAARMPGSMQSNIANAIKGTKGSVLSHLASAAIGAGSQGGVKLMGNIGGRYAGANVDLLENVPEAIAQGLLGEGMGSVMGTVAGRYRRKASTPESNAKTYNEVLDKLGNNAKPEEVITSVDKQKKAMETSVAFMDLADKNNWRYDETNKTFYDGERPIGIIDDNGQLIRVLDEDIRKQIGFENPAIDIKDDAALAEHIKNEADANGWTVDKDGLYTDKDGNKIAQVDKDGKVTHIYDKDAQAVIDNIAFDKDGKIYRAEDGELLKSKDETGRKEPRGVKFDEQLAKDEGWTKDKDGVYVDKDGNKVVKVNKFNEVIETYGHPATAEIKKELDAMKKAAAESEAAEAASSGKPVTNDSALETLDRIAKDEGLEKKGNYYLKNGKPVVEIQDGKITKIFDSELADKLGLKVDDNFSPIFEEEAKPKTKAEPEAEAEKAVEEEAKPKTEAEPEAEAEKATEETKPKTETEAEKAAEEEAKRQAEAEKVAEEEAKRAKEKQAEEEAKRQAEAKKRAEEEAKQKAEAEKAAEEEARQADEERAKEEAKRKAEAEKPAEEETKAKPKQKKETAKEKAAREKAETKKAQEKEALDLAIGRRVSEIRALKAKVEEQLRRLDKKLRAQHEKELKEINKIADKQERDTQTWNSAVRYNFNPRLQIARNQVQVLHRYEKLLFDALSGDKTRLTPEIKQSSKQEQDARSAVISAQSDKDLAKSPANFKDAISFWARRILIINNLPDTRKNAFWDKHLAPIAEYFKDLHKDPIKYAEATKGTWHYDLLTQLLGGDPVKVLTDLNGKSIKDAIAEKNRNIGLDTAIKICLESDQFTKKQKAQLRNLYTAFEESRTPFPRIKYESLIEIKGKKEPPFAYYEPKEHAITYSALADPNTIIHETIHSLTVPKLSLLEYDALFNNKKSAVDKLSLLYFIRDKIEAKNSDLVLYGTTSAAELFAELTNPTFVKAAKNTLLPSKLPTRWELPNLNGELHSRSLDKNDHLLVGDPSAAAKFIEPKKRMSCWDAVVNWFKNLIDANQTSKDVGDAMTAFDALINIQDELLGLTSDKEYSNLLKDIQREARENARSKTETVLGEVEEVPSIKYEMEAPNKIQDATVRYNRNKLSFENDVDKAVYLATADKVRPRLAEDARSWLKDNVGLSDQEITDRAGRINDALENGKTKFNADFNEESNSFVTSPEVAREAHAYYSMLSRDESARAQKAAQDNNGMMAEKARGTYTSVEDNMEKGSMSQPKETLTRAKSVSEATNVIKKDTQNWFTKFHEAVSDAAIKFKNTIETIGTFRESLKPFTRDVLNTYYSADNRAAAVKNEIYNMHGGKELERRIADTARRLNMEPDDLYLMLGYATAAKWAPQAQQRKYNQRSHDLIEAYKAKNKAQAAYDATPNEKTKDALDRANASVKEITKDRADMYKAMHAGKDADLTYPLAGGMNIAQANRLWSLFVDKVGKDTATQLTAPLYDMNAMRLAFDVEQGRYTPDQVCRFLENDSFKDRLKDLAAMGENENADPVALRKLRKEVADLVKTEYVPLTGNPLSDVEFNPSVIQNDSTLPNSRAPRELKGRKSMPDNGIDSSLAAVSTTSQFGGWAPFQKAIADLWSHMNESERESIGFERRSLKSFEAMPTDAVVYRTNNHKAYAFTLPSEVMKAMRRENVEHAGYLLRQMGKVTSFYGRMATQLNAGFAQTNMIRDTWERSYLLNSRTDLVDANGKQIKVGNAVWKYAFNWDTVKAAFNYAFDRDNSGTAAGKAMMQMQRLGGFSTRFEEIVGRKGTEQEMRALKNKGYEGVRTLMKWVEGYNRAWDTVSALATFRALLSKGMTAQDAAGATLETMNFGKKGAKIDVAKCLYPFVQVKATSGQNALGTIYSPRTGLNPRGVAKLAAYSIVMLGLKAMAKGIAGDDKGGNKLDQLPDYVKNNMFAFMAGDKVLTIPLGEGIPRLANVIADKVLGGYSGEITGKEVFGKTFKDGVLPTLGMDVVDMDWQKHPAQAFVLQFCPTFLQPIAASAMNRRSDGKPLYNERSKPGEYLYTQGRSSTPQFFHDVAKWWHDLTGIDMYPEQAKAVFDSLPGLAKQFQDYVINNPRREELGQVTSDPILRRFMRNYTEQGITNQYYDYTDKINDIQKKKAAGEELDLDERKLLSIGELMNARAKTYIQQLKEITKSTKSEGAKEAAIRRVMTQFNAFRATAVSAYRKAEGKIVGD